MRKLVLLLLFCAIAASVSAAAPYQVADLRTTPHVVPSSFPVFFANLDGVTLFTTYDDQERASALWRSDGTEAGTQRLVQFHFGENLPGHHLRIGNTIYFAGQVGPNFHTAILRTDGTVEGTAVVVDLQDSVELIQPVGVLGERIVFTKDTRDLWVADAEGQHLLASMLRPSSTAQYTNFTQWNGHVYVGNNAGLWKTDGTVAGTLKLPGVDQAWAFTVAQDRLFFVGIGGGMGLELWTTDGTAAGTHIVSDFNPGPASTFTYVTTTLVSFGNGLLWFGYRGDFGTVDSTSAGTTMRVLRTGAPRSLTSPRGVVIRDGIAYFAFDDGVHGRELWRTDGTEAGTYMVVDTSAGATSQFDALTLGGSKLYYIGSDATHAHALFESDGSGAPPRLLHDLSANWIATSNTLGVAGDKVLFRGWDAVHGYEPWVYDSAGARLLANIAVEDPGSSNPEHLLAHGDQLYFVADDDDGPVLWRTDGTASGTELVTRNELRDDLPRPLGSVGDSLYLMRRTGELRKLDGEATGDGVLVTSFLFGGNPEIQKGTVQGGRFYFLAGGLWTTDGTEAGTVRISAGGFAQLPLTLAGRTYFVDDRGVHETDGTRDGDRLIAEGRDSGTLYSFGPSLYEAGYGTLRKLSGGAADVTELGPVPAALPATAVTRDAILFLYEAFNEPMQLRKSDGTAAGTQLVREFIVAEHNPRARLVSLGDRVIFSIDDGVHGIEPWVADSTGARLLRDISSGSSDADGFFVADGIAYFAATDELHGRELWQTDGTPEGTKLVADIFAGTNSSSPEELMRAGDTLYFSARSASGRELWAYELPRDVTVTIDDARASESAGSIALTVRLNRASTQRVEVGYTTADDTAKAGQDYTARSGTLAFAPGETVKTVTVPIANDSAPGKVRGFFVRLTSDDVAYERAVAGGIIEDDDDVAVDLKLSLVPHGGGARLRVENKGTVGASNVVLCYATPPTMAAFTCLEPFTLAPGEAELRDLGTFDSGAIVARVTSWESESAPADNIATWSVVDRGQYVLYIEPATPRVGESVKLTVTAHPSVDPRSIRLISSDRHVIAVPDTITIPAGADSASMTVPTLQTGVTIIALEEPSQAAGATVFVYPATGPLKATPLLSWGLIFGRTWGFGVQELTLHVRGFTPAGAQPTGTVEFFDFGTSLGTVPVRNGVATLRVIRPLGQHQFSARYSGDANFTAHNHLDYLDIEIAPGPSRVRAERIPGTNDLLITITGIDGYAPTGSIAVEDADHTENRRAGLLTPVDSTRSTFIATGLATVDTVFVEYRGDQYYGRQTRYIDFGRTTKKRGVRK